MRANTARHA